MREVHRGKTLSEEAKRKSSESNKLWWSVPENRKKGLETIKGNNTKKWIIINPKGEEFLISGLKKFCEENSLSYSCMFTIANRKLQKKHKEYSSRRLETDSVSDENC